MSNNETGGLRRGIIRYDVDLHRVAGGIIVVAVAVGRFVYKDGVGPRCCSVAQREVVCIVVHGKDSILLVVSGLSKSVSQE